MSVFSSDVGFSAAEGFVGGGSSSLGFGSSGRSFNNGYTGRANQGSYQSPASRPFQRPSNFKNSNGYNNRSNVGRSVTPQARTQNTPARGFNPTPSRTPNKGGGFRDLLPKPIPRSKPQGFSNPASKPVSRGIPVDTPTPGRKQPFKLPRLPRMPSGINLPNYPGRIPDSALPPGPATAPGLPIYGPPDYTGGQSAGVVYKVFFASFDRFGGYVTDTQSRDISGPIKGIISATYTSTSGVITDKRDRARVIIDRGNGQTQTETSVPCTRNPDGSVTITIGRVERKDGLPDTGGDKLGPQTGETEPTRAPNPGRIPYRPSGTDGNKSPFARPAPNTPFSPPRVQPQRNLPTPSRSPAPIPSTDPLPEPLQPPQVKPDTSTAPKENPGFKPFDSNKPQGKGSLTPSGADFGTGVDIGRALQRSLDSALNSDELQTIRELLQNPTQTTDEGRNKIFPTNGLTNGGTGVDKSVGLINNPPANKPPTEIDKCCKPTGGNDSSNECDLSEVVNLLTTPVMGDIELKQCDNSGIINYSGNGQGIDGLSNKLDMLANAMIQIWDKVKCPTDSELALPESWAVKTSKTTGQYVIVWRPTTKSSSRWSSTIPHPKHTDLSNAMAAFQSITYRRGDVMVNVQNEDNTQCIMNCESESEAQRLINWISDLTSSSYAGSQLPKITKGMRARIEPREVMPSVVKYYSTGQTSMIPDWIFKVDESGNPVAP